MTRQGSDLSGRVAVVTGGANGIGEGSAMSLARWGADIVIGDIDEDNAARVVAAIRAKGRRASYVRADALEPEQMGRLVQEAARQFGRVDILVNNAGGVTHRPFLQQAPRNWQRITDFNLNSILAATKAAADVMIAGGRGGAIINVSSTEGLRAAPGYSVYAACKAAVISFTKTAALEFGAHGIRVNVIAPDLIVTPGLTALGEAAQEQARVRDQFYSPLGRSASIDEAGDVVAFLASDLASYVTGVTIPVDGGITAASGWHRSETDGAWGLYGA